jgi:hypothetical protein
MDEVEAARAAEIQKSLDYCLMKITEGAGPELIYKDGIYYRRNKITGKMEPVTPPSYRREFGSDCCGASLIDLPECVQVKIQPGVTDYYYAKCSKCGEMCDSVLVKLWDSNGVEVNHGDILECPDVDLNHGERFHAVVRDKHELEIRDLGNNNVGMWDLHEPVLNIGHYSKNLDKLTDEDLEYYWDAKREDS